MDNAGELMLFSIEKLSQINRKLFWDISKKNKLSPIQIQFIEHIGKSKPENCTISGLADEFELKKPTVSDSIKKLIEKGYLEKRINEIDNRSFYLVTTKKCSAEMGLIEKKNRLLLKALQSFPKNQEETVIRFFMNLLKHLYDGGIIHNANICLTCNNMAHHGSKGKGIKKYHCMYLNVFFSDKEIKNNCMSYAKIKE